MPFQNTDDYQARKQAFVAAIYGQESGSGAANTSVANDQNVIGPMQVQFDTFNGMKRLGLIPESADFNNPNHTTRAGQILAESLYDKYNGNPALAAAAYYGGEKAVKNGNIVEFGNRSHPDHPTTTSYAKQILNRMGMG